MIIVKLIIFYIFMVLVPPVISRILLDNTNDVHARYAVGFSIMLFILQIICVPAQLANVKFHYVYYIFLITITILLMISGYKLIKGYSAEEKLFSGNFDKKYIETKQQKISMILFFAVVIFEVLVYVSLCNPKSTYDDSLYLARSANIIYSDSLSTEVSCYSGFGVSIKYAVTSWDVFVAVVAKLTGINSAIVARTLFPTVFLPVAYSMLFLVSKFIFDEKDNIWLFMNMVSFLSIFGKYGSSTATDSLVLNIWQGRSVMFTIFLPFLFVLINDVNSREFKTKNILLIFIVSMAVCSLSPTAVLMVAIETCALGLAGSLLYKEFKKSLTYVLFGLLPSLLLGLVFVIWR